MKRYIKPAVVLSLVLIGLLLSGATTTRTLTIVKTNGVSSFDFAPVTFAAATDTAIFSFGNNVPGGKSDSVQLTLRVSSSNGDSTDLSVRWESSWDNTDWEIFTVGTDSTSWVSTTTGTTFLPITRFIPLATSGGLKAYNRLRIFGNPGNNVGTKVGAVVLAFD